MEESQPEDSKQNLQKEIRHSQQVQKMKTIKLKFTLLGPCQVGKTSIINNILNYPFQESYEPTIGVDLFSKTFRFTHLAFRNEDGKICFNMDVRIQFWDSAGQEIFMSLLPGYIKGASGIIFVYDIGNSESLRQLKEKYIPLAFETIEESQIQKVKCIILGSKNDKSRTVDPLEAENIANKLGMISKEVSAKTGDQVEVVFRDFIRQILQNKVDLVPLKDLYMNLLLHINEDFDDDLLQDALEILADL